MEPDTLVNYDDLLTALFLTVEDSLQLAAGIFNNGASLRRDLALIRTHIADVRQWVLGRKIP